MPLRVREGKGQRMPGRPGKVRGKANESQGKSEGKSEVRGRPGRVRGKLPNMPPKNLLKAS